jgi:hypothetical protein
MGRFGERLPALPLSQPMFGLFICRLLARYFNDLRFRGRPLSVYRPLPRVNPASTDRGTAESTRMSTACAVPAPFRGSSAASTRYRRAQDDPDTITEP